MKLVHSIQCHVSYVPEIHQEVKKALQAEKGKTFFFFFFFFQMMSPLSPLQAFVAIVILCGERKKHKEYTGFSVCLKMAMLCFAHIQPQIWVV